MAKKPKRRRQGKKRIPALEEARKEYPDLPDKTQRLIARFKRLQRKAERLQKKYGDFEC